MIGMEKLRASRVWPQRHDLISCSFESGMASRVWRAGCGLSETAGMARLHAEEGLVLPIYCLHASEVLHQEEDPARRRRSGRRRGTRVRRPSRCEAAEVRPPSRSQSRDSAGVLEVRPPSQRRSLTTEIAVSAEIETAETQRVQAAPEGWLRWGQEAAPGREV
jgi:hypothetical protein